jgi:hypothetical protein
MLEITHFACSNWVLTPVALALGEAAPATISEQRFQMVLTGVGVFTFTGEPDSSGWWIKNSVHFMPDIQPALEFAIGHHGIPTPPGSPGAQYTRCFQVEQWAPHVGLASVEGSPDDLVHEVGYACDAWRPSHLETLTDAFTQGPLPRIFSGVIADLATFRGSQQIHRVNYHVTLIGKVRFAAVVIT